jgi:hypothetical protein
LLWLLHIILIFGLIWIWLFINWHWLILRFVHKSQAPEACRLTWCYIPYISIFPHVFSANQNQKQYTKFTQIKFSLFQSHRESMNHDCLNIWICNLRNNIR